MVYCPPEIKKRIDNFLYSKPETLIEKIVYILSTNRVPKGGSKDKMGNFVEPLHLQLVCEKLWDNIIASQGSTITENIVNWGNVDKSLEELYVKSIHDVKEAYHLKSYIKNGRISEDRIREWFDKARFIRTQT